MKGLSGKDLIMPIIIIIVFLLPIVNPAEMESPDSDNPIIGVWVQNPSPGSVYQYSNFVFFANHTYTTLNDFVYWKGTWTMDSHGGYILNPVDCNGVYSPALSHRYLKIKDGFIQDPADNCTFSHINSHS